MGTGASAKPVHDSSPIKEGVTPTYNSFSFPLVKELDCRAQDGGIVTSIRFDNHSFHHFKLLDLFQNVCRYGHSENNFS